MFVFWMMYVIYLCIVWSGDCKPTLYPILVHYMGLCEDDPSCDKTYNAVMPLSRALARARYSRIVGVTNSLLRLRCSCACDLHLRSTVLVISIYEAPSWSPLSPARHLDLHRSIVVVSQTLLLWLSLPLSDKVKQLHGDCIAYNKATTIWLLPVADNSVTKHDHLIQQFISHQSWPYHITTSPAKTS